MGYLWDFMGFCYLSCEKYTLSLKQYNIGREKNACTKIKSKLDED